MGNEPAPAVVEINLGIPCAKCKYNLRGLPSDGLCPECGESIPDSVETWMARIAPTPSIEDSDPRWVEKLVDGLGLAVVGFLLIVLLGVAPPWVYEWRSPQRAWMLGFASSAWVLCGYAVWKLTSAETGRVVRRRHEILRIVSRVGGVVLCLSPFVLLGGEPFQSPGWIDSPIVVAALWVMLILILAAGVSYYPYLSCIAWRGKSTWLGLVTISAWLFAALMFLAFLAPQLDGPEPSLDRLMDLPTLQFASPSFCVRVVSGCCMYFDDPTIYGPPSIIELFGLAIFVVCGLVHVLLFLQIRSALKAIFLRKTSTNSVQELA